MIIIICTIINPTHYELVFKFLQLKYFVDEEDELLDDFADDLLTILSFRYGFTIQVPKSKVWLEEVLPQLGDNRFKQVVRVTKKQRDIIFNLIKNYDGFHGGRRNKAQSII